LFLAAPSTGRTLDFQKPWAAKYTMPSTTATPVDQSCICTGSMALARGRRGRIGRGPGSNARASGAAGTGAASSTGAAAPGMGGTSGKLQCSHATDPAGFALPQSGQVMLSDMIPHVVRLATARAATTI
jgi:hypothetical protein